MHQTWHLVGDLASARSDESEPTLTAMPMAVDSSLRHRVQMARVDRRWSIDDLSQHARCDASALAAFERGDEILTDSVQRSVCAALHIDLANHAKRPKRAPGPGTKP